MQNSAESAAEISRSRIYQIAGLSTETKNFVPLDIDLDKDPVNRQIVYKGLVRIAEGHCGEVSHGLTKDSAAAALTDIFEEDVISDFMEFLRQQPKSFEEPC